jgi:hypothetical protein
MKTTSAEDEQNLKRFVNSQSNINSLLSKVPVGCQNWSYQKSVNFKALTKKSPSLLKLKPSSKHVDVLKMENHLHQLEEYYK